MDFSVTAPVAILKPEIADRNPMEKSIGLLAKIVGRAQSQIPLTPKARLCTSSTMRCQWTRRKKLSIPTKGLKRRLIDIEGMANEDFGDEEEENVVDGCVLVE
jgi:hypothetical protein